MIIIIIYLWKLQAADGIFYYYWGWNGASGTQATSYFKYSTADLYKLIIFLHPNSEVCFAAIFYPSLIRNLFLYNFFSTLLCLLIIVNVSATWEQCHQILSKYKIVAWSWSSLTFKHLSFYFFEGKLIFPPLFVWPFCPHEVKLCCIFYLLFAQFYIQ